MFASGECRKVVSILEAVFFGRDNACIDLGMGSVYWAVLAFVLTVVILKFAAKGLLVWLVARIRNPSPKTPVEPTAPLRDPLAGPKDDGGPIRSTRTL